MVMGGGTMNIVAHSYRARTTSLALVKETAILTRFIFTLNIQHRCGNRRAAQRILQK